MRLTGTLTGDDDRSVLETSWTGSRRRDQIRVKPVYLIASVTSKGDDEVAIAGLFLDHVATGKGGAASVKLGADRSVGRAADPFTGSADLLQRRHRRVVLVG